MAKTAAQKRERKRRVYQPPTQWPTYEGGHDHTWEAVDCWHAAVGDFWIYLCTGCKEIMQEG